MQGALCHRSVSAEGATVSRLPLAWHGQAVPPGSCRCRRMCHSGGSLQGRPQSEDPRDGVGARAPWPHADCPARPPHIQPRNSLAVCAKHSHKLPEPRSHQRADWLEPS